MSPPASLFLDVMGALGLVWAFLGVGVSKDTSTPFILQEGVD